jgi:CspA family cold shock protein
MPKLRLAAKKAGEMELFFQFEAEAAEQADSLRARGFDVVPTAYEGGQALAISGPPELMEALWKEVNEERRSKPLRMLTGTVLWWKDDKGYGRITGDDGYVYFSRFSALQMEGYKSLREGQRVEFTAVEAMADHGRAGAANVRVID